MSRNITKAPKAVIFMALIHKLQAYSSHIKKMHAFLHQINEKKFLIKILTLIVPIPPNIGCVYTGTLERFYLEPFRVGTDRLPVYIMSWNRSVQKINIVLENIMVENIVLENYPF